MTPLYPRWFYIQHINSARLSGFTGLADALTAMMNEDYPDER